MYAFTNIVPIGSLRNSLSSTTSLMKSSRAIFSSRKISQKATIRAALSTDELVSLGTEWDVTQSISPFEVMKHALTEFGNDIAIAFSGAEDVVLIEYAHRTKLPYRVFSLDTGRLHAETYRFYAEVEKHYGIKIEYTFPDTEEVVALVNEKGMFSFYEDGHQECCRIRKVRPLRKKLGTLKAWITGQRKDQSPGTRTNIPMLQLDPAFKGIGEGNLFKYNPLANTSSADVWATIRSTEIPFNSLHLKGFISIGCEPCTKAVLPNQHEREGRWWWEEATQKECGLHKGNISKDSVKIDMADDFVNDNIRKKEVVVFTKKNCKFCASLKELLNDLQVDYNDVEISELDNYGDIVAALERKTGQTTAPNLFIGQNHIGGNAEATSLYKEGKLVDILQDAGVSVKVGAK